MANIYLPDTSSEYLQSAAYAIVFGALLFFLSTKYFGNSRKSTVLLLALLGTYLILFFVNSVMEFLPHFPDTERYASYLEGEESHQHMRTPVYAFYLYAKVIGALVLYQSTNYIAFSLFVYGLSILLIMKAWTRIRTSHLKHTENLPLAFFGMVGMALFVVSPLREVPILFGWSLLLYAVTEVKLSKAIVLGVLGITIFTLMRPPMGLAALLGLMLMALFHWRANIKIKAATVLAVSLIGFSLVAWLMPLDWSEIAEKRNYMVTVLNWEEGTYGFVDWSNPLRLLLDYPILLIQFLVAPFPLLEPYHFSKSGTYILDTISLLVYFSLALIVLKKNFKAYRNWLALALGVWLTMGFIEYDYSAAVRHRLPFFIILVPMAFDTVIGLLNKRSIEN